MINSRKTFQMEKNRLIWMRDSNGRYTIGANVTLLEGVSDRKAPWKLL